VIALRPAERTDGPAVAELYARTCAVSLPFLRILHTPDEDLAFFSRQIVAGNVTLAESETRLLGFISQSPGWIDHLYIVPEAQGQGIGTMLLRAVQQQQDRLDLWCFAQNSAGRSFYERMGFQVVRETAGENEQGLPDILYRWQR
jgi:GNAT superfamily N-acetyltransferase